MALFDRWFQDAKQRSSVAEANAMSLATVGDGGVPSVRMVLLKAVSAELASFTWFTNLASRKAMELATSGSGALCWWWPGEPGRQVRAVGAVRHIDRADSQRYFDSRPASAQAGAIASHQSRAVNSRRTLDGRLAAVAEQSDLTLPEEWGGLELIADELEFWQGRGGRLHDRIVFLRTDPQGAPLSANAIAACGGIDSARAAGTYVEDTTGTQWLRVRLEP